MKSILFKYTLGEAKGVIELNQSQYEGICILNKDLVINNDQMGIKLEEVIPITKDKLQYKSLITEQVKLLIQRTFCEYPDEYSEETVKEVIRWKFYHKYTRPTFLLDEISSTRFITKEEIQQYLYECDLINDIILHL